MGGHLSHEYHYLAPIGDENLKICSSCSYTTKSNTDANADTTAPKRCSMCNGASLEDKKGIEVASIFH